jgi:aminoglycoside phosphotransferase (APT) family kinase protein
MVHSSKTQSRGLEALSTLRLNSSNHGPFPLCHGDFGHKDVIVDDESRALGVIDWAMAFAAPWEVFADFPLKFSMVP